MKQENYEDYKKSNFTQVMDLLDHLTLIEKVIKKNKDGKIIDEYYIRRRLRPIEKETYRVIYKTGGLDGICWKSTRTLANEVNCSTGSISKAKTTLFSAFEQLDGMPLIDIETHHTMTIRNDKVVNKKFVHKIRCNDVWAYNARHMKKKAKFDERKLGRLTDREAEHALQKMFQASQGDTVDNLTANSQNERASNPSSVNEHASQGARSSAETNHMDTSFSLCKSYTATSDPSDLQLMLLIDNELKPNMDAVIKWLSNFGVKKKVIADLVKRIKLEAIVFAIEAFKRTWGERKVKKSLTGMLISDINRVAATFC